ncbi:MAG: hypothetical protein GTO14_12225, partial [Anaerolineales bacterium]|nr:hypothetical protein [Anaerolineales bacterium]
TATITSQSPIPSVFDSSSGKQAISIIGRDTEVEVLGESTNEEGELYYLIRGFGTEGWIGAGDVTFEAP